MLTDEKKIEEIKKVNEKIRLNCDSQDSREHSKMSVSSLHLQQGLSDKKGNFLYRPHIV